MSEPREIYRSSNDVIEINENENSLTIEHKWYPIKGYGNKVVWTIEFSNFQFYSRSSRGYGGVEILVLVNFFQFYSRSSRGGGDGVLYRASDNFQFYSRSSLRRGVS